MTESLSDERLAEIEQRCAAATPGPWRADSIADVWGPAWQSGSAGRRGEHILARCTTDGMTEAEHREGHRNAAFIAGARSDVPDLLAEVRRLRAVERELRGHVRALVDRVESLADRAAEGS